MSEQFPSQPDDTPKIMEYIPFINEDNEPSAALKIDGATRGIDFTATLRSLTRTEDDLRRNVGAILKYGYAEVAAVSNETFENADDLAGHLLREVAYQNRKMGKKPKFEMIHATLQNVLGAEAAGASEEVLLERFVDNGHYAGLTVWVSQHNNIVSCSDDEIAAEVERLRQQYGDDR